MDVFQNYKSRESILYLSSVKVMQENMSQPLERKFLENPNWPGLMPMPRGFIN